MNAPAPLHLSPLILPYFGDVEAGFPSPAQDYLEQPLDLSKLLVRRPAATFYFRAKGGSMAPSICHGDVLVVDKSATPQDGDVVIASVNGDFLVKRLRQRPGFVSLMPDNPDFSPILVEPGADVEIWGVVTGVVRVNVRAN